MNWKYHQEAPQILTLTGEIRNKNITLKVAGISKPFVVVPSSMPPGGSYCVPSRCATWWFLLCAIQLCHLVLRTVYHPAVPPGGSYCVPFQMCHLVVLTVWHPAVPPGGFYCVPSSCATWWFLCMLYIMAVAVSFWNWLIKNAK